MGDDRGLRDFSILNQTDVDDLIAGCTPEAAERFEQLIHEADEAMLTRSSNDLQRRGGRMRRRNVAYWPIATDRIWVADRRFRGITDMAGAAAGRTRTRMTQSGHQPT